MSRRFPTVLIVIVAFAALATACSSDEPAAETTTTTLAPVTTIEEATTTTTLPPPTTTTTTIPELEVSAAINGLPADEELIDRRVVAVKIDNHPNARPQSGLEVADATYEVLVEGGLTRYIALFHQSDLDFVGPNRSGRPTDAKLMPALAGAPFQVSGAQGWVQNIFRAADVNIIYDNGVTTYRMPHRRAPHNLYTSTLLIREYADDREWPDTNPGNLFLYGEPIPLEDEATHIEVSFSSSPNSIWDWDGEQYLHSIGNEPHMWEDADGESDQVAYDTLVVMKMRKYIARNPAGSGTSLPTVESVGTGEAFVFHSGGVVGGTWERGSDTDRFSLIGADGTEMPIPPGRVWMMLVPDTEPVVWE